MKHQHLCDRLAITAFFLLVFIPLHVPAAPAAAPDPMTAYVRELYATLESPDEVLRAKAVQKLGEYRVTAARARVEALLLRDPAPVVRESAAQALMLINPYRAPQPVLLNALQDTETSVRAYSIVTLGKCGDSSTVNR